MKFRQLEYFVAVADELNFTRAAAFVGVSQPGLSAQIRTLEAELGVSLFDRDTHRVALTSSGESFLKNARLILDQVDLARRELGGSDGSLLRVGSFATGGMNVVRRIVDSYKGTYSGAEIDLIPVSWGDIGSAVREGRVDVAFVIRPPKGRFPEYAGLMMTKLRLDPRVAVVRRGHALADRRQLSVDELAPYAFVSTADVSAATRDWWAVIPRPDGSTPLRTRGASSVGDLLEIVAITGDVAITTESAAEINSRPDIEYIPLVDVEPAVINLAWSSAMTNQHVRRFVNTAKAAAES